MIEFNPVEKCLCILSWDFFLDRLGIQVIGKLSDESAYIIEFQEKFWLTCDHQANIMSLVELMAMMAYPFPQNPLYSIAKRGMPHILFDCDKKSAFLEGGPQILCPDGT